MIRARRHWLGAAAAVMFCLGRDAAAQSATQPAPAPARDSVTTRGGVFTAEQASRGRDVYLGSCRSCHTVETHTGAAFEKWSGRPLSELYAYIRAQMPKNEPGSLSAEEYADVLAYLLRMNQMPAGKRELPADSVPMKAIRIETTKLSVRKDP